MRNGEHKINTVIRDIALLMAVRKSRLVLIGLLIVDFLVRHYHRYGLSGMVILLWLVIAPFIAESFVHTDKTKQYTKELPHLCKKFRFQYKEMVADLLVCGISLLFLLALLWANRNSTIEEAYIVYSPIAYILVSIITFAVLYFTERRKIGTLLENNLL